MQEKNGTTPSFQLEVTDLEFICNKLNLTCTTKRCEDMCSKYSHCDNIAYADDILKFISGESESKKDAEKATYTIAITETLEKKVEIKADSEEEAVGIAREQYREDEITLGPGNYKETKFMAISCSDWI
jgi:hypothetical protein